MESGDQEQFYSSLVCSSAARAGVCRKDRKSANVLREIRTQPPGEENRPGAGYAALCRGLQLPQPRPADALHTLQLLRHLQSSQYGDKKVNAENVFLLSLNFRNLTFSEYWFGFQRAERK